MTLRLKQHEIEELSAWMDGELPTDQAAEMARKVQADPAWTDAAAQLRALNGALDAWDVPAASNDLKERILLRATTPQPRRIIRWLTPLAAAAAVLIAVLAWQGQTPVDTPSTVPEAFVQTGLDLFAEPAGQIQPGDDLAGRIRDITGGSLADAMKDPQTRWADWPADQQDQARQRAYAFLKMTPEQQAKTLAEYETANEPARRIQAERLRIIVNSFTRAERQAMQTMQPSERARRFLQRREELIQNGTLPAIR